MDRIGFVERALRRPSWGDGGGWFTLADGRRWALPVVRGVLRWDARAEGPAAVVRWQVNGHFDRDLHGKFRAFLATASKQAAEDRAVAEVVALGGAMSLLVLNYRLEPDAAWALAAGAPDRDALCARARELALVAPCRDLGRLAADDAATAAPGRN